MQRKILFVSYSNKVNKMAYPYIIQGSQVTVVIGSKPHVVSKSHPMYQRVVDAIKANDCGFYWWKYQGSAADE